MFLVWIGIMCRCWGLVLCCIIYWVSLVLLVCGVEVG